MKKYALYVLAICLIAKKVKSGLLYFDEHTFDREEDIPHYEGDKIVSLFNFKIDTLGHDSFTMCLERNGFTFERTIVSSVETEKLSFLEFLFDEVYNYFIGEEKQTSDEFLSLIEQTMQ